MRINDLSNEERSNAERLLLEMIGTEVLTEEQIREIAEHSIQEDLGDIEPDFEVLEEVEDLGEIDTQSISPFYTEETGPIPALEDFNVIRNTTTTTTVGEASFILKVSVISIGNNIDISFNCSYEQTFQYSMSVPLVGMTQGDFKSNLLNKIVICVSRALPNYNIEHEFLDSILSSVNSEYTGMFMLTEVIGTIHISECLHELYSEINNVDPVIEEQQLTTEDHTTARIAIFNSLSDDWYTSASIVKSIKDKALFLMIKALRAFYGFDRFEIKLDTVSEVYEVIIHYPEFTITDSNGKTSVIKDLFIKYKCNLDNKFLISTISNIQGKRTTYFKKELVVTYAHSHLKGISYDFNKFCQGSEATDPINSTFTDINRLLIDNDTSYNNWFALCIGIDSFIKHENSDGRPYRRLADIKSVTMEYAEYIHVDYLPSLEHLLLDFIRFDATASRYVMDEAKVNEFNLHLTMEKLYDVFDTLAHSVDIDFIFIITDYIGNTYNAYTYLSGNTVNSEYVDVDDIIVKEQLFKGRYYTFNYTEESSTTSPYTYFYKPILNFYSLNVLLEKLNDEYKKQRKEFTKLKFKSSVKYNNRFEE